MKKTNGNPKVLHPKMLNPRENPILHNIATSWNILAKNYYGKGSNIWESFILYNPILKRENDGGILCKQFFAQNPPLDMTELAKVKLVHVFDNTGIFSRRQIFLNTGIDLNLNTYMRLTTAVRIYLNTDFRKVDHSRAPCPLLLYINRFKKGSNRFRKVLEDKKLSASNINELRQVKTYYGILGVTPVPRAETNELLYSLWSNPNVPNKIRDFIFRFTNNALPLNTRVSHFVQNYDRSCTMCTVKKILPASEETFRHLFFDCPFATEFLAHWENYFGAELNNENERLVYWFSVPFGPNANLFQIWAKIFILYKIWETKIQKALRPWHRYQGEIELFLGNLIKRDSSVRRAGSRLNFEYALYIFHRHGEQQDGGGQQGA